MPGNRFPLRRWKELSHKMAKKPDDTTKRPKAKKPNFDAHAGSIRRSCGAARKQAMQYLQIRMIALTAKHPKLDALWHGDGEPWRLQVNGDLRPYEHNAVLADKRYLEMCLVAAEAYCRFEIILGEILCPEPSSK